MKKSTAVKALCLVLAIGLFIWFVFFFERDGARYVEPDGTFRAGETWTVENGFELTFLQMERTTDGIPELITRGEKWQPDERIALTFRCKNLSREMLPGYELAALFGGDAICAEPYPVEEKTAFFPGEEGLLTLFFAAAAGADPTHVNVQHRVAGQMHWATFVVK